MADTKLTDLTAVTIINNNDNIYVVQSGVSKKATVNQLPISAPTQTALDLKVDENVAITGATKTKITYDSKGLVTAGADATTNDIADSLNKRYVTDANLTTLSNTSGTNTGDQDLSNFETTTQLNTRDTNNRDRTNHTGTQLASTISDFQTTVSANSNVTANTAKVTNATHTGEVTGATTLTLDKTAITNKSSATVASGDLLLIADINDSNNLKQVTAQSIADLGGGGVSDGDKGDITVSSSGTVWTIDNDTIGLDELSATGTPSSSTYLRGDNTWGTPAGSGAVDSVNGQTGVVVLDADDIDDNATTNKFTTSSDISKLAGIETGAEANNISDANATDLTDGGDTTLHIHDSRYYTETETDTLLGAKEDKAKVTPISVSVTTAAATAAKVGTTTGGAYTPATGDIINVTFSLANTATNPTINIDGSGAKSILLGNVNPTAVAMAGTKVLMWYDGTAFQLFGSQRVSDSNTAQPTEISEAEITAGTASTVRSISGRRSEFIVTKARGGRVPSTDGAKLDGIEAGAEVNNISDTNATDLTDGGDTTLHTHDSRYYTESEVDTFLSGKQNTITNSDSITQGTTNLFLTTSERTKLTNTSGTNTGDNAVNSLYSGLATSKQDTLVSGTNIKTINSTTLLGSGNVAVEPTITAGTTAQYYRGDKTFQTLDKTAVGLGNVDNTSDSTKNSATATLTNKTITSPRVNQLLDTNGNVITTLTPTASAVNYIDIKNNGTGFNPSLSALGSDTNISINLIPKGTGRLRDNGVIIPNTTSADTLTNKRITKRTGTTTSSATPTINTDNVDFYSLTALAVNITSFTTNLSGTPTDGQTLWIAITGTATRTIAWGASFESSTVTLPVTTVGTARLDVGFVWNAVTSKWRCVAVA